MTQRNLARFVRELLIEAGCPAQNVPGVTADTAFVVNPPHATPRLFYFQWDEKQNGSLHFSAIPQLELLKAKTGLPHLVGIIITNLNVPKRTEEFANEHNIFIISPDYY